MKSRRLLAFVTAALFLTSHALPAYEHRSGFTCFRFCVETLLKSPRDEWFGWFYYGGFAVSNVAFVALAGFAFTAKKFPMACRAVIAILTAHVVSWPFFNLSEITAIRIGYYVWLSSYLLLAFMGNKFKETKSSRPLATTLDAARL